MNNKISEVVSTFSIVGFDPNTKELGIAVQSKFLAVGAVVPWAKAKVGAIATQSWANTSYGPNGLAMLEEGKTAEEVLNALIANDPDRELRQVGIVDANGNAAAYTGNQCHNWAGHITGPYFAAQGNILVSKETVEAMADTFQSSKGDLAERLLAALAAGGRAGGDSRGEQSAALYIVKEQGGYGGFNDRYIDLRVDDHKTPIQELERIYQLHRLYFYKTKQEDVVQINEKLRNELSHSFFQLNYAEDAEALLQNDEVFYKALQTYIHTENFEERELEKGYIDQELVNFIRLQVNNSK